MRYTNDYLDTAIAYARQEDVIITTFGDMLKVPGTSSSLNQVKAEGRDIRIIYSPMDSLQIAKDNPDKKLFFLLLVLKQLLLQQQLQYLQQNSKI